MWCKGWSTRCNFVACTQVTGQNRNISFKLLLRVALDFKVSLSPEIQNISQSHSYFIKVVISGYHGTYSL